MKNLRDNFEEPIERIHEKLKVIGKFEFDKHVKININLFTGYTTEELSEVFGDINKYNQSLSEIDLLASRLYNINSFVINDMVLVAAIKEELRKYYDEKSKDEVLDCFQFHLSLTGSLKKATQDEIEAMTNFAQRQLHTLKNNKIKIDSICIFEELTENSALILKKRIPLL